MAQTLKRQLPTRRLKTGLLTSPAGEKAVIYLKYDALFDAVILMFVPPTRATVVHYVGPNVALLYDPKSLEIVGLQIEAFKKSVLPKSAQLRKAWRTRARAGDLADFGSAMIAIEQHTPAVAEGVFRASTEMLPSQPVRWMAPLKRRLARESVVAVWA
jgi:hypothetical protein